MNLIKFGIVSAAAGCMVVVACGGSSSDNSSSTGGTSSSSGGTSSSTAGSSAKGGSSTTGTAGSISKGGGPATGTGGTSTGTGGVCNFTMDPTGMTTQDTCPAATTCVETKCKATLDSCTSATGACADTFKCDSACNCDQTCIQNCANKETAACQTCINGYLNCTTTNCLNEIFSCVGSGGSGSGGTFGTGGTGFDFDAGTYTCADLTACCKKLSGDQQTSCNQVASGGLDFACSLAYSSFCPAN